MIKIFFFRLFFFFFVVVFFVYIWFSIVCSEFGRHSFINISNSITIITSEKNRQVVQAVFIFHSFVCDVVVATILAIR